MATFEWVRFLESNQIHYVTSGPNVSRGHVAVHCPFCGPADKSQHMSINLEGKGWRCFRNRDQHRGKSPVYLVQALLGITNERARALVGEAVFIPDDFMGAVMDRMAPKAKVSTGPALEFPAEFKPIKDTFSARRFIEYLTGPTRRFTKKQVLNMTPEYDLRYATSGPMKGRIIFPVFVNEELMTWTGRTIYPSVDLRYKTLSTDPEIEKVPARGPINDYLLFYDLINDRQHDSDTLILCEGPFDALKVSVLGLKHGIDATCFFTASPSAAQIDSLFDIIGQYDRAFLLLDQNTLSTALRVQSAMAALKVPFLSMPPDVKDPGLLDVETLLKIIP